MTDEEIRSICLSKGEYYRCAAICYGVDRLMKASTGCPHARNIYDPPKPSGEEMIERERRRMASSLAGALQKKLLYRGRI